MRVYKTESEQLANEGTSVNERWKVVSICLFLLVFLTCAKCSGNRIIGTSVLGNILMP